jgi:hypothetical protein
VRNSLSDRSPSDLSRNPLLFQRTPEQRNPYRERFATAVIAVFFILRIQCVRGRNERRALAHCITQPQCEGSEPSLAGQADGHTALKSKRLEQNPFVAYAHTRLESAKHPVRNMLEVKLLWPLLGYRTRFLFFATFSSDNNGDMCYALWNRCAYAHTIPTCRAVETPHVSGFSRFSGSKRTYGPRRHQYT